METATGDDASTLQLKAGVRIFGGFDKLNPEFEWAGGPSGGSGGSGEPGR